MNLTRYNGEHWYFDRRSLLSRIARWIMWAGGWEAHSPKAPWSLGRRPLRQRLRLEMLAPISLFGHRLTYYGWGMQVKTRNGFWVWKRRPRERRVYWSPNGTPNKATIWWKGAPRDVLAAAREHHERRDAEHVRLRSRMGVSRRDIVGDGQR